MNDTILAFLSALAIYGLANLALPRSDWDTRGDDPGAQFEDTAELPPPDDSRRDDS